MKRISLIFLMLTSFAGGLYAEKIFLECPFTDIPIDSNSVIGTNLNIIDVMIDLEPGESSIMTTIYHEPPYTTRHNQTLHMFETSPNSVVFEDFEITIYLKYPYDWHVLVIDRISLDSKLYKIMRLSPLEKPCAGKGPNGLWCLLTKNKSICEQVSQEKAEEKKSKLKSLVLMHKERKKKEKEDARQKKLNKRKI